MNFKLTFEERAARGRKILAKQKPTTIKKARAQVARLKRNSKA